jgi:hypothetical protein
MFTAGLMLGSGPVSERAQEIGDACLSVWWIPGLIGIALGFLSVRCALEPEAPGL